MPYRVTDACIACGDCTVVCPQKAILEAGSNQRAVDTDAPGGFVLDGATVPPASWPGAFYHIGSSCNNCGHCREVCPVEAIVWEGKARGS